MLQRIVTPAKAGVQCFEPPEKTLDSGRRTRHFRGRLRRNDGLKVIPYRNLVDAALVHCQQSYYMLQVIVTPAKAGVQCFEPPEKTLDSGFRRNDGL